MQKIINGFRYNTETATLVAEWESSAPRNDFRWAQETLYKSPRAGHFFIAGEGGPMTRWAHACGDNSRTGGNGIIPVSKEDALAFCERSDTPPEDWEEYFEIQDA